MFNSPRNAPLDLALIGVPKSGTTSLYTWLAAHPDVQGSEPKETFYFIDFDGSRRKAPTFDDEGWDGFDRFFPGERRGRLRLEASPSNVFSEMAWRAFTSLEPSPLLIVALRDPAEQIRSGFYYSQNNGAAGDFVDPELTFPAYVDALLDDDPEPLARAVASARLRWYLTESLQRNQYADWLDRWAPKVPSERLLVLGFEELTRRPRETVEEICRRAGIDPSFYAGYEFERINATVAERNGPVRRFEMFAGRAVPPGPVHDLLAESYRRVRPRRLLASVASAEETSAMTALGEYFASSNKALAEAYGVDVSTWWPRSLA